MKKLLAIFGFLTISSTALAEDTKTLQFPKIKSQIEIPTNCNVEKSKTKQSFKVKCNAPKITATYREGEYKNLKDAIVKINKEAKKMFETNGFKILKLQELQTKALKSGGEIISFVLVMEKDGKQKIKVAQVYTLITLDKKGAASIVQTYDPSQETEGVKTLMKQLSAIKPLKK